MVTSPALRPADATLWEPLTAAEIEARSDQHGRLSGRVPVEFEDLIDGTHVAHADVDAALVVRDRGLKLVSRQEVAGAGRGGKPVTAPVKRQTSGSVTPAPKRAA